MQTINLISWNVNGIRASVKKGFIDKIEELNPDILCLQETKATAEISTEIGAQLNSYHCFASEAEKKGYSGTAIFTKKAPLSVLHKIGFEEHDSEGRVVAAEFDNFYVINVYVPNAGAELKRIQYRKKWDKDFLTFIESLKKLKPVIITGDFNVAHEPIDLARPDANYNKTAGYTQIEIDGFDNMLNAGLSDTFRVKNPEKVLYSFWSQRFKARDRNVGWRIDYFLVNKELMPKVEQATIFNEVMGSDHCPIQLIIKDN